MYRQISIIFIFFGCLFAFSGCGIKGPLYQTPPEQVEPNTSKTDGNSSNSKRQED
jgi:predicted small lipoprotein YifL